MKSLVCLLLMTALANADVRIEPKTVHPGDPVLVIVTDADTAPKGTVDGKPLQFFPAKRGYQAVFAVGITGSDPLTVKIGDIERNVKITPVVLPEADVVVEEELANPPEAERKQIDEDNQAMIAAMRSEGNAQFTRAFVRPRGKVTSQFGEWRTFNDGYRSQHLGMDTVAKVGARVSAINAGTVTLVRDTYLAGKIIVIAHGAGIASAYFHLSDASVAEGDVVKRGQRIGKAGQTGRATGPHLHLAVRAVGGLVNPATFFKLELSPATREVAKR